MLWILRTGARWQDLPERFSPYQTCHRRFSAWAGAGILEKALKALTRHLRRYGDFDLSEWFIDGSFVGAKKGAVPSARPKRGKGTKLMAVANRDGAPVAIHIESASPSEVRLVEATLARRFTTSKSPERLIGDKAYDSDPLDQALADQGVEMIAPHRANRTRARTQDGRVLRRYRHRWKIERLFAWLHNFRRLVVRYEYKPENFLAFVQLACLIILMRMYF